MTEEKVEKLEYAVWGLAVGLVVGAALVCLDTRDTRELDITSPTIGERIKRLEDIVTETTKEDLEKKHVADYSEADLERIYRDEPALLQLAKHLYGYGKEPNLPDELLSLEAYEAQRPGVELPTEGRNGIACPRCGQELWDDWTICYLTYPAEYRIFCKGCGWDGMRH